VLLGPEGERVEDGAVLVHDGTILAVGPHAELEPRRAPTTPVFDFPDSTLLPGLINCHVHLAFDARPDPVTTFQNSSREQLLEGMADRAGQALRCGITTLRDLGDDGTVFALRDAIAAGTRPGPRILASGPPLTVEGGHCHFFGGIVDDASLRTAVREHAAAGADLIKIMVSGGSITPGGAAMYESQFTLEQLRIVVDEACRAGLRVAAHAHGADAITDSVQAGVTTIEHCGWMIGPAEYDRREQVARRMAAQGIYACGAFSHDWERFYQRLGERGPKVFARFQWMDALGVPFIAGTDAGLSGSVFDRYALALAMYAWLGFANERILEFATINAADALGLAATTGRLAAGLASDLLVVDGNPLADIQNLDKVRLVMTPTSMYVFDSPST